MADWEQRFDNVRGAIVTGLLAILGIYLIANFAAQLAPETPGWLGPAVIGSIAGGLIVYLRFQTSQGGR